MINEFGQEIGPALPDWQPRSAPIPTTLFGEYCRLEPLEADRHGRHLQEAFSDAPELWTYLSVGPFESAADWHSYIESATGETERVAFAVIPKQSATTGPNRTLGTLSLVTTAPANGVTEIGWVAFSPLLRRTRVATEAFALILRHVFDDLHYRRCEWKCDTLNAPSRRAAERLGFTHEGTFRQAAVYKQRSRDTHWFSLLDSEWARAASALDTWLAAENFDEDGQQRRSLDEIRRSITV